MYSFMNKIIKIFNIHLKFDEKLKKRKFNANNFFQAKR